MKMKDFSKNLAVVSLICFLLCGCVSNSFWGVTHWTNGGNASNTSQESAYSVFSGRDLILYYVVLNSSELDTTEKRLRHIINCLGIALKDIGWCASSKWPKPISFYFENGNDIGTGVAYDLDELEIVHLMQMCENDALNTLRHGKWRPMSRPLISDEFIGNCTNVK